MRTSASPPLPSSRPATSPSLVPGRRRSNTSTLIRIPTPATTSNVSDAPYLGEAATVFALTRRATVPLRGDLKTGPPVIVYVRIACFPGLGLYEHIYFMLSSFACLYLQCDFRGHAQAMLPCAYALGLVRLN